MNGEIFERCLVYVLGKRAEELGLNDTEFSNKVPALKKKTGTPQNAWRAIRNGQRGKFREVSIEEAYDMAIAVGTTVDKLCWDVFNELRNGWSLEKDVSLDKSKPGRPSKKPHSKKEASENQESYTHRPAQPSSDEIQSGPDAG